MVVSEGVSLSVSVSVSVCVCFFPSFGGGRSGAEMQPAMNLLKLFGERERSCFFLVAVRIFGVWGRSGIF